MPQMPDPYWISTALAGTTAWLALGWRTRIILMRRERSHRHDSRAAKASKDFRR